jgi:hypothetical protein
VRDRETIDAELRLIAAVRRSIREHGGVPSTVAADQLLDERLEIRSAAGPFNVLQCGLGPSSATAE